MKIIKWLIGLIAAIGSIAAIMLVPGWGSNRNKRIKEINKESKKINANIKKREKAQKNIEKSLKNKKKAVKEIKKQGKYKSKKVSGKKAANFLKKYAKKDK